VTAVGSTSDVRVGVKVLVGCDVCVGIGVFVGVFVGVLGPGVLVFVGVFAGVHVGGCFSDAITPPPVFVTHGAVVGVFVGLPGVHVGGCFSDAITPLPAFVTHGAVVGVSVGLPGVHVGGCFSEAITPLPAFVTHGAVVGVSAGFVGVLVAFAGGVQVVKCFSDAATPLGSAQECAGVGVEHRCSEPDQLEGWQEPSLACVEWLGWVKVTRTVSATALAARIVSHRNAVLTGISLSDGASVGIRAATLGPFA
jgi:hypothetical protein